MAKKKPSPRTRKRSRAKNLASPAGTAARVKGGLLVSTKPLLASPQLAEGDGQPPNTLRK